MRTYIINSLLILSMATVTGCFSGPSGPEVPKFDPAASTAKAMSAYDTNSDGSLDTAELKACGSLRGALARIDADGNGQISTQELQNRLNSYLVNNVGAIGTGLKITKNGKPIKASHVKLVPEEFMLGVIPPAECDVDDTGVGYPTDGAPTYPGVYAGFYRLEISGGTTVPADGKIGCEIALEVDGSGTVEVKLDK